MIDRKTGAILPQKFLSEAFTFFHTINAFEDDGHLVVDLCSYEDGRVLSNLYIQSLASEYDTNGIQANILKSEARRYVLPIASKVHYISTIL